jgi:hypothetical protein
MAIHRNIGDIVRTDKELRVTYGPGGRPDDVIPARSCGRVRYLPRHDDPNAHFNLGVIWYHRDTGEPRGIEVHSQETRILTTLAFDLSAHEVLDLTRLFHDPTQPKDYVSIRDTFHEQWGRPLDQEPYCALLAHADPAKYAKIEPDLAEYAKQLLRYRRGEGADPQGRVRAPRGVGEVGAARLDHCLSHSSLNFVIVSSMRRPFIIVNVMSARSWVSTTASWSCPGS